MSQVRQEIEARQLQIAKEQSKAGIEPPNRPLNSTIYELAEELARTTRWGEAPSDVPPHYSNTKGYVLLEDEPMDHVQQLNAYILEARHLMNVVHPGGPIIPLKKILLLDGLETFVRVWLEPSPGQPEGHAFDVRLIAEEWLTYNDVGMLELSEQEYEQVVEQVMHAIKALP